MAVAAAEKVEVGAVITVSAFIVALLPIRQPATVVALEDEPELVA